MAKSILQCPSCGEAIAFREWSKRQPPKSEALGSCPKCGKVQVRCRNGKPVSVPYKVKAKAEKTERGSYKLRKQRKAAIIAVWGSVQEYLDHSVIQVGMTQQYKT